MFRLFGRSRRQPAPAPRQRARLALETLEGRDLPAVGPIFLAPLPAPLPSPVTLPPAPASGTQASSRSLILNFEAVEDARGIWTFQGQVGGQIAPGQQVQFGGLPGLKGCKTPIRSGGSFSLTLRLPPGTNGTVTAQTGDSNVAWLPIRSTGY